MLFSVDYYVCWFLCVCVILRLSVLVALYIRIIWTVCRRIVARDTRDRKRPKRIYVRTLSQDILARVNFAQSNTQLRWQFRVHLQYILFGRLASLLYHLRFFSVEHFCKHQKRAVANRRNIKMRSLLSFGIWCCWRGCTNYHHNNNSNNNKWNNPSFGTSVVGCCVLSAWMNKWKFQMIFISQYLVCLFSSLRPKWCHFIIMAAFSFFYTALDSSHSKCKLFFKHPNWHFVYPSNSI